MRANAIFVTVVLLAGCASVQPVSSTYRPRDVVSERRVDTSYKIGQPVQAFVGERMLRVQDYYVRRTESAANEMWLSPTSTFTLRVPPLAMITVRDTDYAIVKGTTERDGKIFRLISLPGPEVALLRFLIDENGAFEGSAINHSNMRMGWSYVPEPQSVRFIARPMQSEIDVGKGFTNFELIYGGTTKDSFQVLYREYTRDDLARPAFSQTVVYDKSASNFRFRNIEFSVEEVSSERIKFTVVSDKE